MTVRNDCRIEWVYQPVVLSASGRRLEKGDPILPGTNVVQVASAVSLDLCFGVGDCVLVKPWLLDEMKHHITGEWYEPFPKHPVMFLGIDGLVDDRLPLRVTQAKSGVGYGIEDLPIPFFDPNRGIVHLPLSAIDQVITKDGPRRSRWVVQEASKPERL